MMPQRLLEIFYTLIKIDSLSSYEKNVADYIMPFLTSLGLEPYSDFSNRITGSNIGNVLCKVGNGGNIVLLSHMDTARSTVGVNPIIKDDKITSDGTTVLGVDNRVGIASLLFAIEKHQLNKTPLKDFTLAFTTQEETTLAGSLNLELDENVKCGVIFDSHHRPGNFISESTGSKGFKIKVIGKAAHSGLAPERGIDSIKIASNAISQIEFGRIDPKTTANIGLINGGTATNVVPEETHIEGEVRSFIYENIDNKLNEVKKTFEITAATMSGKIEFESFWNFYPYKILPDSLIYKIVETALENVGLNPTPCTSQGGSDANSLNGRGIECINIGIGAQNPHSNDEFILLKDFAKTAEIALELMKK